MSPDLAQNRKANASPGQVAGKFITFEGIDGAGKTTHLDWFRQRLEQHVAGLPAQVVMTREPGGTPLGESLRELLLHRGMHLETEALLMFAARREHLAQVIVPALARGDWVLSDRFTDATFAYQGGGRGVPLAKLAALEQWVQGTLQPDLTVLFDLPTGTAAGRRQAARDPDKFESQSQEFFIRTRDEYLRRAAEDKARFVVIDASQSIENIRKKLEDIIVIL
jgi:dTMP kinase